MKQKVFSILKPKVSAFGFDKSEVMGIAADIANNLKLKDDATEEEIDEAIENAVESAIPFLKYGQSQANRVINEFKRSSKEQKEDETEGKKPEKKEEKKEDNSDSLKELTNALKAIQTKLDNLEAEKATTQRRAKLEKLLEGSGAFGKSKLRDFARMNFEKEDDFENYCEEIKADLESFNQESANEGLGKTTPPQVAGSKKNNVMSDDEIANLADSM